MAYFMAFLILACFAGLLLLPDQNERDGEDD